MKEQEREKNGRMCRFKVRFKFAKNICIVKFLDVSESLVNSDQENVMQIQTLSDK